MDNQKKKTLLIPTFIYKLLPHGGDVVHLLAAHAARTWFDKLSEFLLLPWRTRRIINF